MGNYYYENMYSNENESDAWAGKYVGVNACVTECVHARGKKRKKKGGAQLYKYIVQ